MCKVLGKKITLACLALMVKCSAVLDIRRDCMSLPVLLRINLVKKLSFWALLVGCSYLAACASPKADLNAFTETGLYEQAQSSLRQGNYIRATELLRRLEADYPFGNYAQSAQLSLIYAYYKSDEVELADAAARRFIRLHPNHNNVDYAYYLRGLAAFPEPSSFFQSMFSSDLSRKSMEGAQNSFRHFSDLIKQYPDSLYVEDARLRMTYLRNLLARHEINVANFYMDYKAYTAAINRGQYVLENFQKSPAIPDALAILIKANQQLALNEQAANYLTILKQNYPEYPAINADGTFNVNYTNERTRSIGRWLTFGIITDSKPPGFDTREIYQ